LPQRPLPLGYRLPRREPCPATVAEDSQEVDLMVLLDTDLVIRLDLVTILLIIVLLTIVLLIIVSLIVVSLIIALLIIVSVIDDSLTTTWTTFSFVITAISSSLLTSFRLVFLIGGILTPITTLTITVLMITRLYTITGIGTVWPRQYKRPWPSAAITTGQLTG
jgi:hypothetical protein